ASGGFRVESGEGGLVQWNHGAFPRISTQNGTQMTLAELLFTPQGTAEILMVVMVVLFLITGNELL
ncbi:MAG: hypothetical protein K6G08_07695, partial [Prevotella sp.]|nr:hypothetical protein [Prevotella sp.]